MSPIPLLKRIYKKIRSIPTIRNAIDRLTAALLAWAAKSPTNSRIYYALFSRKFAREQYAYLQGRLKYQRNRECPSINDRYLLRRNTHRLEKGLLMMPRRNTFALDYIVETVNAYRHSVEATKQSSSFGDEGELKWARDVLEEYFQVVDSHPIVEKARKIFLETVPEPHGSASTTKYVPYQRDLEKVSPVSFDSFMELSVRRRSVRWYLPKKVPRELIDKAITAAAQSPSACNRQPFIFHIFDAPELVGKVAQLPMGITGYEHNIPVLVVIVGRLRAYEDERDRHLIYIDGSLAAMSFMLALETLGLSSCPINWPDIEWREQQMAKFLRLDADERPIMLIAVGYPNPDGAVAYSQKKSLENLRRYNFE
jgi:nitroreductase